MWVLKKDNEDSIFIWDLYLGTNIVAAIITAGVGSNSGIYFPVYVLSLLGIYYIAYTCFMSEKNLAKLMHYVGINILTLFGFHLLFSFQFSLAYFLFILSSIYLIYYLYYCNKGYMGIYVIPLLYYLSLFIDNIPFTNDALALFVHSIQRNIYMYDHFVILILFIFLIYSEIRFNRFIFFKQSDESNQYEKILRYRVRSSDNTTFQSPKVTI